MSNGEIVSGLIALLAVIVSFIAMYKAALASSTANDLSNNANEIMEEQVKLSKKQVKMESVQEELNKIYLQQIEEEDQRRKVPIIELEYEKVDVSERYFIITNKGHVKAIEVNMQFVEGLKPAIVDLEGKFPSEEMNPGESIRVLHARVRADPDKFKIEMSWKDLNGKSYTSQKNIFL